MQDSTQDHGALAGQDTVDTTSIVLGKALSRVVVADVSGGGPAVDVRGASKPADILTHQHKRSFSMPCSHRHDLDRGHAHPHNLHFLGRGPDIRTNHRQIAAEVAPELMDHEGIGQALNGMRWSVVTTRSVELERLTAEGITLIERRNCLGGADVPEESRGIS
jgi:hypothetical protein